MLSITCGIFVDLHGKFIQNAKEENPKPMAVEGDANKEAKLLPHLNALGLSLVALSSNSLSGLKN